MAKGDRDVGVDSPRGDNGKTERGFVVEVNKLLDGNRMSFDIMLDNFRERFTNNPEKDKKGRPLNSYEHLIAIDEDGYAHVLMHGAKGSVGYSREDAKGRMIIHNHPNDSVFSRTDLRGLKDDGITGIVASGKSGDYIFKLRKGFKYAEFDKALAKSPITDVTSDLARTNQQSINWLRANQKRYGYTFEYRKREN